MEEIREHKTKSYSRLDKSFYKANEERQDLIEKVKDASDEISRIVDDIHNIEYDITMSQNEFGKGNIYSQFRFEALNRQYRRLSGWRKAYNKLIKKLAEI